MLSQDVQAYLAVRRAMGFGMKWSGNLLRGFAAFSEAAGQHHVCSETAIKWAGSTPSVRTRARRLGLVIRLARYLRAEDKRHEVPPPVFGSEDRPRRTPYIYSKEDLQRLVQAASGVGRYPNPEYRGLTYSTFFGLLAVPACDCRKRSISGCKTSLRMVLSFDILNSAKADCCRSIRPHKLRWSVICRSDASLPPSTITCSLACENTSCFGTTPTLHFAELSRRSAFRVIRAFRGPRSMRCDTHLP
jgi:hypothetical protein